MADILAGLYKRKGELNKKRYAIKSEMEQRLNEVDKEISEIDSALNTLMDLASDFLCKRCSGRGYIGVCDAAGQTERMSCPRLCGHWN